MFTHADQMDTDDMHDDDDDRHSDQSKVLHLLCHVSGHHNIANVTLPWLLNHLKTISTTSPYSDNVLEDITGLMGCIQSIVEQLSVSCDDDDIEYFKPFILDMLKLFIDPTLNGDSITDPHVFTDSKVLSKCAALLRVSMQGVNRCINVLEYAFTTFLIVVK